LVYGSVGTCIHNNTVEVKGESRRGEGADEHREKEWDSASAKRKRTKKLGSVKEELDGEKREWRLSSRESMTRCT
jgi:hypothetical protein